MSLIELKGLPCNCFFEGFLGLLKKGVFCLKLEFFVVFGKALFQSFVNFAREAFFGEWNVSGFSNC
jgi:hypothetical protein